MGHHPTGPGSAAKAGARGWCVASSRGRAGRHCHRVGEAGVGVTPQAWPSAPEAGGAGPCDVIARAGGAPMRRGGRVLRDCPHVGRGAHKANVGGACVDVTAWNSLAAGCEAGRDGFRGWRGSASGTGPPGGEGSALPVTWVAVRAVLLWKKYTLLSLRYTCQVLGSHC